MPSYEERLLGTPLFYWSGGLGPEPCTWWFRERRNHFHRTLIFCESSNLETVKKWWHNIVLQFEAHEKDCLKAKAAVKRARKKQLESMILVFADQLPEQISPKKRMYTGPA